MILPLVSCVALYSLHPSYKMDAVCLGVGCSTYFFVFLFCSRCHLKYAKTFFPTATTFSNLNYGKFYFNFGYRCRRWIICCLSRCSVREGRHVCNQASQKRRCSYFCFIFNMMISLLLYRCYNIEATKPSQRVMMKTAR